MAYDNRPRPGGVGVGRSQASAQPLQKAEPITSANYVDEAAKVMQNQVGGVTTSQLRNLLSLTADIYNQLRTHPAETLSEEIRDALTYLRVQFVYAAGRKEEVKQFMESANLDSVLKAAPESRENALLLCRYMEALAAYKKYYDREDK